jgi:hypothetical protein
MITVYCDESHDQDVYALAGWIGPPSAWERFDGLWRDMLSMHFMPDGTAMKSFHAADIVNRDEISDSPFRGWSFDQEKAVFKDAVGILTDKSKTPNLWPVGCAVAIPSNADWVETRNTVWHLLFCRLLTEICFHYRGQHGFSFVFDEKDDNATNALSFYKQAKPLINQFGPGKLDGASIAFMDDEDALPLQAADLFAYEWRKRIAEKIRQPQKRPRTSYRLLMESKRENAMLRCYGRAAINELKITTGGAAGFFSAMMNYPTTED